MRPTTKQFSIEFGEFTINLEDAENQAVIKGALRGESANAVRNAYEDIWDGDLSAMGKLPLESFLPMIVLKQISSVAKTFEITPNHLEYGFDPEMFYSKQRPFYKKKRAMLKEIDSEFSEKEDGEDPYAFQVILDENVVNAFLLDFVLYEKAFSLRQIMKLDEKTRGMLTELNTTNIGLLIAEVLDEFGADKDVDLYISLSHSLISKKVENAKLSGFQIDKNGNFRFQFNFSVTILVDGDSGWIEARSMYVGLTAKGKFLITEKRGEKVLSITPKGLEVSNLKIFNQRDEAMVSEEMMFTTGLNIQLEQFISMMPSKDIPLAKPPSPKELECLGLKLTDMDLKFKKGYLEVTFGYRKVKFPSNPMVCEKFLEYIRRGPSDFLEGAQ